MFKGEKTAIFWLGLVVFGYSIYQFCVAGFEMIYYNIVYPSMFAGLGSSSTAASFEGTMIIQSIIMAFPGLTGGVVFLIIGLYIMKVGVKRDQALTQS